MSQLLLWLARQWKFIGWLGLTALLSGSAWLAASKATNSAWELKWSQRDTADAKATARQESRERAKEQHRQLAINQVTKDAEAQFTAAHADAVNAQSAADRLQRQLADIQAKYRRSETGRLSALADASAGKAETARVLAELLSESDKAAGIYAAEADRAYIAGQACERAYDEVTGVVSH